MTKAGAALLATVSFLVGGGCVLLLLLPLSATPKFSALKISMHHLLLSPACPALWSPEADNHRSVSIPLLRSYGVRQSLFRWWAVLLLPSVSCSGGALGVIERWEQLGYGWLFWAVCFGWCLGILETKVSTGIARGVGFLPEWVPAVYHFFISTVVFSLCFLVVFWATGVGSGWSCVLLFVSTGLLCGFPLWFHVTLNRDRLRWCLVLGLCAIPKGVGFYGPSGIIKLLTVVLVSAGPSTGDYSAYGGLNLWSILRLDGLVFALYVIIVFVIVSLALITY